MIRLERPLRPSCFYCVCSCCLPHKIEIQAPPGTVVGYVKQEALGLLHPWFSILNADEETILRIKGPLLGCSCYSDTNFLVRLSFISMYDVILKIIGRYFPLMETKK